MIRQVVGRGEPHDNGGISPPDAEASELNLYQPLRANGRLLGRHGKARRDETSRQRPDAGSDTILSDSGFHNCKCMAFQSLQLRLCLDHFRFSQHFWHS